MPIYGSSFINASKHCSQLFQEIPLWFCATQNNTVHLFHAVKIDQGIGHRSLATEHMTLLDGYVVFGSITSIASIASLTLWHSAQHFFKA
jgi:hypothetical protein